MPTTVFFRNYVRDNPLTPGIHRFPYGVAYFSADRWWYSGVNFGGEALPVAIDNQHIDSLKGWINALFHDREPVESTYEPGTAYRRIAWPLATSGSFHNVTDANEMTQSFVALKILLNKMQDVFESVEPADSNVQTYGHKIRELLLLAAMEVEASWAAVLRINGYPGARLTTKDYVKLLGPMLLDSFSLGLRSYPAFPTFSPFKGWSSEQPTKSLAWYDAYNQTKHNREEHLDVATLEHAIRAVGAATVMFYAQFGYTYATGDEQRAALRNVFNLNCDNSLYPMSCYIPNAGGGTHAWEWTILGYPFVPAAAGQQAASRASVNLIR